MKLYDILFAIVKEYCRICGRREDKVFKIRSFAEKHKETLTVFGCTLLYGLLAYLFRIPCPIKETTGVSCPGCGMSRALISMLKFDWSTAVHYHPLVFFVIPVLICLIIFYERKTVKAQRILLGLSVLALLAVYIYRMIIVPSPVLEFAPENSLVVRLWTKIGSLFR